MASISTARLPSPIRLRRALFYLCLVAVAAIFITPLVWMLSTSFKTEVESVRLPPTWVPEDPTTVSYREVLNTQTQTPVLRWFLNSLIAALGHSILVVATAAAAAYALARMEFRGKRLLFGLIISTLFVPPIILLVPNYVIVSNLGWLDSVVALVVPAAGGAFGVFFMRQFFMALPKDLLDAAEVDGANHFRMFWHIALPLAKPALATLLVLSFLTNWNEFLWALFVMFSPENLTLPPGLAILQRAYATEYNIVMVGGVIATAPVLALYVIVQRFVIEGVAHTGLKG